MHPRLFGSLLSRLCWFFLALQTFCCFATGPQPWPWTSSCPASEPNTAPPVLALNDSFELDASLPAPAPIAFAGISYPRTYYADSNALEWQTVLALPEGTESPLYHRVQSADLLVAFPAIATAAGRPIHARWNRGSHAETQDFQPQHQALQVGQPLQLSSFGGRSADGVMPYVNVSVDGGGFIIALGWSGDWTLTLELQSDGRVHLMGGLQKCHFRLHPGDSLRLPSMLCMGYQGDWIDGQNQFRQWMLQHATPKNHSPMNLMPVAASVHGMIGFNDTNEENLSALAQHIASLRLPLDTFWLDAGWNEGGFPAGQGNPHPDAARFPNGLSGVGKIVQQCKMRFLVWFEPERAMRHTWLHRQHPEWLLTPTATPEALRYMEKDGFMLLDFGNRDAREWALEQVSRTITEANISIYRQDFNEYPAYFWHTDEPADQVGLREVRYINGLYDFFDALLLRHPHLIIDNCASGGRRFDYEILRRSVVLWRSDSCWDSNNYPRNVQAMSHGLSHWIPLHGLGSVATDPVSLRSGMGACSSFAIAYRDPSSVDNLSKHLERYLGIRHLFTKQYFPLTPWSDQPNQWLAVQFHDADKDDGIVQAFCHADDSTQAVRIRLRGLVPDRSYRIADWDSPGHHQQQSGEVLMQEGIRFNSEQTNRAIVLQYESIH